MSMRALGTLFLALGAALPALAETDSPPIHGAKYDFSPAWCNQPRSNNPELEDEVTGSTRWKKSPIKTICYGSIRTPKGKTFPAARFIFKSGKTTTIGCTTRYLAITPTVYARSCAPTHGKNEPVVLYELVNGTPHVVHQIWTLLPRGVFAIAAQPAP